MATVAAFALVGTLIGSAEAKFSAPFDYSATGVEILDFELDFNDIEIILDVHVTEPLGTLELSFEREFFDSKYEGVDDGFTIIADGDLVYYAEMQTSPQQRTIKLNLVSGTEQVEIFGTQLKGITAKATQPKTEIIEVVADDKSDELAKLFDENEQLRSENKVLKEENKKLDSRIFELENLVSALEVQIKNLNALVLEQVKVIYNWVIPN